MEKQIIVVADLGGLTDNEFVKETDLKAQAMIDNAGIVTNPDPTGLAVQGKVTTMTKEIKDRDLLLSEAQQKTTNIETMRREINNIMTGKWANQIQNAVNNDEGKVELLRFKVKGKIPTPPPNPDNKPIISKIDINIPGQHTLNLINNLTHKKALPKGILRIDIYGQTGGNTPANLSELITNGGGYLGQAVKGKFINVFTNQKTGTIEYYIAVYVSNKTKKPFSQSTCESAVITM